MRRFLLVIFCFLLLLACTGCSDYLEINDTAMVAGIAIDVGENQTYKISVEVIQPAESESSKPTAKVISDEGNNVEDSLKRLVNSATKELQFSHCKLILFSEDVAKSGISDLIDYFLRNPEFRADLYLATVVEFQASEMLSVGEKEQRVASFDYASVIKNSYEETGSVPPTKLYQFYMDGELTILPCFERIDESLYSVSGASGFRSGKQYARVSLPFMQSVMLVSGEYKQGEILLITKNQIEVPCQIRSVKVKKKVSDMNPLKISVNLECDVYMTTIPKDFDISTNDGLKTTQEEIARLLAGKITADWDSAVEQRTSDMFGLEVFLRRHEPRLFEQLDGRGTSGITLECECEISLENLSFSEERLSK